MYLKKLALSGFKSFADNTLLEFGPGITAIVGPNGSGKSNVVDALQWAMGERSNKALRGHASTDVIFSGSGSRKPLGLAEVSLFFDNEDNALPIDFKEVQVTRRVFRDGEGEYAINKTKCRLRDVTDLFLDTGVGTESFSIISQGEIDAILSAKPEDRRSLIEGAAGVQKYNARRTETRRKLDRVEVDLTRVADIMFELDNQLGPLSRQAELAREHENYIARLRVLQLAILARDYETRAKRLEGLTVSRREYSEKVREGTGAIAQHEIDEREISAKMRELESVIERVQSEFSQTISRLKSVEGEIAVARERRRALTEQQEIQAREIGLLRGRIQSAQEKLAEDRAALTAAKNDASTLSGGAAEAEAKLGAANARLSEAARELQSLQTKVVELIRASQSKREAAATGKAETAGLQNRLAELEKLAADLDGEIAQTEKSREAAQEQLTKVRAAHADSTEQIEAARTQLQSAQDAQNAAREELNAAREKGSGLQSRLNALRELEENLEGVQGGARAVLAAVKRGQLPDEYTLVADAMRAPKELEQAIEVALGAGVHNLICFSDANAKKAIHWLKDQRAGRATFLPIPNLRPSNVSEKTRAILRARGVRGLASQLVDCDNEFRAAIDYLLGRVLIVESLDVAVALAKNCDFGVRLVTLEGELVLPAGAITGGAGRQKSSGLLARKRELDESEARLSALETEVQNKTRAVQDGSTPIAAAQENLRKKQDEASELRSQIARQERELEHAGSSLRRITSQKEAVLSQLRATREAGEKKAISQTDFEREAELLDIQAKELDAAVARAQEIVTARQNEREQITSDVSEVRAQYSANREKLAAMQRAIVEAQRAITDYELQISQKQQSIEKASGEDAHLVTREADLVSLLSQLQARHEELETDFNRTRRERQAGMARLETLGVHLREGRSTLHEAEEELHRVEVRLASTETEIAEIQRRFEEEFELPFEEALAFGEQIEQKNLALEEIEDLRNKIGELGTINTGALAQYEHVKERLDFLGEQKTDLETSKAQLEEIIADIDSRTRERFMKSFNAIREAFADLFVRIFDGGSTHLALTEPDNILETGIDLRVQLPGKAQQDISLLSGGERALTALAFLLAILRVHPSPFVVLDEVDAPLDQSNVGRYTQLLREFTENTQFIIITHNNGTMQAADVLYGVTQQEQGISTLMSVRLADAEEFEEAASAPNKNGRKNLNGKAEKKPQTVAV
jgi:chromosome segregation protein